MGKEDMMKKMMAKGKSLSPLEKKAKMGVLSQLKSDMQGMMANKLGGLKKVTVASPDEKGLETGLDTAKNLLAAHTGHDEKDPMVESDEEMLGEDLDHDDEQGESEAHKDAVFRQKPNEGNPMHTSHDFSPEKVEEMDHHDDDMDADNDDEDSLNAQIEALMKKKSMLKNR